MIRKLQRSAIALAAVVGLVAATPALSAQAQSVAGQVATTTVLEAPNRFGINDPMPLRIQVTAATGSAAPTGSITLLNGAEQPLQTIPLTPAVGGGYSWAIVYWWTFNQGRQVLRAVYNPNDPRFGASQSTQAGIFITETTPLAVLRLPDRFVVGATSPVTVLINPANGGGSATFSVNNRQLFPSTRNVNGMVTFPWTPPAVGNYTFTVEYSNQDATDSLLVRQAVFAASR